MATRDFRSQQIRITQIVASGSDPLTTPSLLIYSASVATNDSGGYPVTLLDGGGAGVGADGFEKAWLFISGSRVGSDGAQVLFGGNIIVSGTITGSTFASRRAEDMTVASDGNISFVIDKDANESSQYFEWLNSSTQIAKLTEAGTLQLDGDLEVDGGDLTVTAGEGGNAVLHLKADESDDAGDDWTFTSHAGTNTLRISNDKASAGTPVAHVTITPHATVANSTVATAGILKVGGNIIQASDGGNTITLDTSDNVTILGDLKVSGGDIDGPTDGHLYIKSDLGVFIDIDNDDDGSNSFKIRNGGDQERLVLDESGNLQIDGTLQVDGNIIKASDGGSTITMDTSDNVIIAGDLQVGGGDITGPTDGDLNIKSDGHVNIHLDDDADGTSSFYIKAGDDNTKFTLTEAGIATFTNTVRVPGNIEHEADPNTGFEFTPDTIVIKAGASGDGIIVNESGLDVDFRVETAGAAGMIHTIGSQNAIKIGSNDTNNITQNDVNFKVVGTAGAHQAMVDDPTTTVRGVALFTGDLVVSGTLYAEKQVMEVDLVQSGSNLILSSSLHFKNTGPGAGSHVTVPPNDGSIYVSTGSLYAKLANPSGDTTEVLIGQNYVDGNGLGKQIDGSNTIFHSDINELTGSFTNLAGAASLAVGDELALADISTSTNETKKITVTNFVENIAGVGDQGLFNKPVGGKARITTNDGIVAHLTGSVFSGRVGITGSNGFSLSTVNKVGIGVSDPDAMLEVYDSTAPQLKISYDADTSATLGVNSSGNLTLSAIDDDADIIFRVDDNGSNVIAATIDGSDFGSAKFTPADGGFLSVDDGGDDGSVKIWGSGSLDLYSHSNTGYESSIISFVRTRGTVESQTKLVDGTDIGKIDFWGFDTAKSISARILVEADGDHGDSATDAPGRIKFLVSPDGDEAPRTRMTIRADGNVGIGSADPKNKLTVASGSMEVFGGDLIVNRDDNTDADPIIKFQLDSGITSNWTVGIDDDDSDKFKIKAGAALSSGSDVEIDTSGNLVLKGDLTVGGNDIKDSGGDARISCPDAGATVINDADGTTVITVHASDLSTTLAGTITVSGNALKDSGGDTRFAFPNAGATTIQDASGDAVITVGASDLSTTLAGDLTVSGGDATIRAANDTAANIVMKADNSDDAGDDWTLTANTGQTFTIGNDIASGGTAVPQLTITPNATAANSVTTIGKLKVAGNIIQNSEGSTTLTLDTDEGLTIAGDLEVTGGDLTVGSDADGTDRTIVFGHSTLKSVIGVDDDQDVFAINTDAAFQSVNDFEIDASGNVTLGTGTLTVGGNIIKNSEGTTTMTMDANEKVTIAGDLHVGGGDATIKAANDTSASLTMQADNSDDAGDDWTLTAKTDQTFTIGNDIANAGTPTAQLTIAPHASPALSVTTVGKLKLAGNVIQASDGGASITLDTSDNVTIGADLNVPEYIKHHGDANTYIRFDTDDINIQAGGVDFIKITEGASDSITFNDGAADVDFRVESSTNTHALFIDGGLNTVTFLSGGISTEQNTAKGLDVSFFVSGSTVGRGDISNRGISVFGGDLMVSGTLYDGNGGYLNKTAVAQNAANYSSYNPSAAGANAVAIGKNAVASGANSIAMGSSTTNQTDATATHAVAIGGDDATASGDYSAVLGGYAGTASGHYSVALGGTTNNATGNYSVAAGETNTASGLNSIAIGKGNTASATNAIAIGESLTASSADQILIGNSDNDADIELKGNVETLGNLTIPEYLYHSGDTDTYIRLRDNHVQIAAGGNNVFNYNVSEATLAINGDSSGFSTIINTANKLAFAVANTTDQVLILSGGHSTSPNMGQTTLDTNFFVSGTIGSKDSATVRGTAVFGGDVHISGSLSGPSAYALTDNNVRVYRDLNTMMFDDGENDPKSLSDLATASTSTTHFTAVHGATPQTSKLKATGSVSFSGNENAYVDGLSTKDVGADVFVFFSGSIGAKAGHAAAGANQFKTEGRAVTLFGGDAVFSGSAEYLGEVSFANVGSNNNIVATGSFIAGGNTFKNSNADINMKFASSTPNVIFGDASVITQTPQSSVHIAKASNTQAATDNEYSHFGLSIRNDSTQTNAFAGIAFDVNTSVDADSIGAAIRAERDTSASTSTSKHDTNLTFATNDTGDSGLTERMRITHDGKVGIGSNDPATALHIVGTDSVIVPVGTTAQRGSTTQGAIRYNTTLSAFEGYSGAAWSSLGGVKDVDGDTYILAETSSGTDNDDLVFVTGGTERMTIDSHGGIGITGSLVTSTNVTIGGDLTISGDDIKDSGGNTVISFDGSGNVDVLGSITYGTLEIADLKVGGDDIKDSGNNVAISFDGSGAIDNNVSFSGAPTFTGNVDFADRLRHIGDTDTQIRFLSDDKISFEAAGVGMMLWDGNSAQKAVIVNEGGNDHDFRVEGQNDDHLLWVQAGEDRVGIGKSSPAVKLHVKGNFQVEDSASSDQIAKIYASSDDGILDLYANNSVTSTIRANADSYVAQKFGVGGASPENALTIRHTGGDANDGILVVRDDNSTADGNLLGGIGFDSTDGNVPSSITEASAFIAAYAAEAHSVSDKGADLVFGASKINDDDDTTSHEYMRILDSGLIGMGVVDPDSALEILNTTSQLKLSYDGSNAATFTVDSAGTLSIDSILTTTAGHTNSPAVQIADDASGGADEWVKFAYATATSKEASGTFIVSFCGAMAGAYIRPGHTFLIHAKVVDNTATGLCLTAEVIDGGFDDTGDGILNSGWDPTTHLACTWADNSQELWIKNPTSNMGCVVSLIGGPANSTFSGGRTAHWQIPVGAQQEGWLASIDSLGTITYGRWADKYYDRIRFREMHLATTTHLGKLNDDGMLIVRDDAGTTSGELLGGFGFDSTDGNVPSSILEASCYIAGYAAESHSVNDKGGYLTFGTSIINDNDDTVSTEWMRLNADGELHLKGTSTLTNSTPTANYARLYINGGDTSTADNGMTFGATSSSRVYFQDEGDDDAGVFAYSHGHYAWFKVETNESVRFYGAGVESIKTDDAIDTAADFFTNGHQYYSSDPEIEVGDCCVLVDGKLAKSTAPMQKNVAGIAWIHALSNKDAGEWQPYIHREKKSDNPILESKKWRDSFNVECDRAVQDEGGNWVATPEFASVWKVASVGDSRQPRTEDLDDLLGFKVCNEGGAVEAGDLLCTSSTPGYLMKQPDDLIHGYTVAKAMENVTFDELGLAVDVYGYIYCG